MLALAITASEDRNEVGSFFNRDPGSPLTL
jgi:hypothetical protein